MTAAFVQGMERALQWPTIEAARMSYFPRLVQNTFPGMTTVVAFAPTPAPAGTRFYVASDSVNHLVALSTDGGRTVRYAFGEYAKIPSGQTFSLTGQDTVALTFDNAGAVHTPSGETYGLKLFDDPPHRHLFWALAFVPPHSPLLNESEDLAAQLNLAGMNRFFADSCADERDVRRLDQSATLYAQAATQYLAAGDRLSAGVALLWQGITLSCIAGSAEAVSECGRLSRAALLPIRRATSFFAGAETFLIREYALALDASIENDLAHPLPSMPPKWKF